MHCLLMFIEELFQVLKVVSVIEFLVTSESLAIHSFSQSFFSAPV